MLVNQCLRVTPNKAPKPKLPSPILRSARPPSSTSLLDTSLSSGSSAPSRPVLRWADSPSIIEIPSEPPCGPPGQRLPSDGDYDDLNAGPDSSHSADSVDFLSPAEQERLTKHTAAIRELLRSFSAEAVRLSELSDAKVLLERLHWYMEDCGNRVLRFVKPRWKCSEQLAQTIPALYDACTLYHSMSQVFSTFVYVCMERSTACEDKGISKKFLKHLRPLEAHRQSYGSAVLSLEKIHWQPVEIERLAAAPTTDFLGSIVASLRDINIEERSLYTALVPNLECLFPSPKDAEEEVFLSPGPPPPHLGAFRTLDRRQRTAALTEGHQTLRHRPLPKIEAPLSRWENQPLAQGPVPPPRPCTSPTFPLSPLRHPPPSCASASAAGAGAKLNPMTSSSAQGKQTFQSDPGPGNSCKEDAGKGQVEVASFQKEKEEEESLYNTPAESETYQVPPSTEVPANDLKAILKRTEQRSHSPPASFSSSEAPSALPVMSILNEAKTAPPRTQTFDGASSMRRSAIRSILQRMRPLMKRASPVVPSFENNAAAGPAGLEENSAAIEPPLQFSNATPATEADGLAPLRPPQPIGNSVRLTRSASVRHPPAADVTESEFPIERRSSTRLPVRFSDEVEVSVASEPFLDGPGISNALAKARRNSLESRNSWSQPPEPFANSLILAAKVESHVELVVVAIESFLQCLGKDQPPNVFVQHSKFVVVSAQKLLGAADLLGAHLSPEDAPRVLRFAHQLCESLKTVVLRTKEAAVRFPSPQAMRRMLNAVETVSRLASDLKKEVERHTVTGAS